MMSRLKIFQSTHPIRDATRWCVRMDFVKKISIHASHTGCDHEVEATLTIEDDFNPRIPYGMRLENIPPDPLTVPISIHASHTGCDPDGGWDRGRHHISIHASHTGCDSNSIVGRLRRYNISIHASHTGCDVDWSTIKSRINISIHASHTGCDHGWGGWTWRLIGISIHASHTGCDASE